MRSDPPPSVHSCRISVMESAEIQVSVATCWEKHLLSHGQIWMCVCEVSLLSFSVQEDGENESRHREKGGERRKKTNPIFCLLFNTSEKQEIMAPGGGCCMWVSVCLCVCVCVCGGGSTAKKEANFWAQKRWRWGRKHLGISFWDRDAESGGQMATCPPPHPSGSAQAHTQHRQ